MKLIGIGASNGIVISKVFKFKKNQIKISNFKVQNKKIAIQNVEKAIKKTINKIKLIKQKAKNNLSKDEIMVFDAHIHIASDPSLIEKIKHKIINEEKNELLSVNETIDFYSEKFASMDNEYMKERGLDLKDVGKRIINILANVENNVLNSIKEEVILIADDIEPSEITDINKKYVKGILINSGSINSHSSIIARSLKIPLIICLKDITKKVKEKDIVAFDGKTGEVWINPIKQEKKHLELKVINLKKEHYQNLKFKSKKTLTKDGKHIKIFANIGSPKDLDLLIENDAEGIGLFRTEFLYMDSNKWPTEDEQFNSYKIVLEKMKNKKVIVRTLDIGGDKKLQYFNFPKEDNPFLGNRSIRFSLDKKNIFKTQLRALLRASIYGKLAIMFPMIATIKEFLISKDILNECKKDLLKEGYKFDDDIKVGMMVEVPSSAIMINKFAKYADFFSIGTNDLIQYTMAADRINEKVSHLYQPLNPAVLNMINIIINDAHKNNKWVGICGEMANDINTLPLLIGMGIDELSMISNSVLEVRKSISKIDFKKAQILAKKALLLETNEEVKQMLKHF